MDHSVSGKRMCFASRHGGRVHAAARGARRRLRTLLLGAALLGFGSSAQAVVIGYEAYLKGLTPDENGVYQVPPGEALEYRLAIDLSETEWDDHETGDVTTTATAAIDAAISSYTLGIRRIRILPLEFSAALADFVADDGGEGHGVGLVDVFSSAVLARDDAGRYSSEPLHLFFLNIIEVGFWGGDFASGYSSNPAVQLVVYRDGRDALDLQMPNIAEEAGEGRVVILGLRIPLRADIGDGMGFSISMPEEFFGPQTIGHPLPGYGAVINARIVAGEVTVNLPAPITINVQSRALRSLTLNGEPAPALSLRQARENEPLTTTLRLSAADQFGADFSLASVMISSTATNGAAVSVRREDAADGLSATLIVTVTPDEDADTVVSLRAYVGDVSAEATIGVDAVDREVASLSISAADAVLAQANFGDAALASFTLLAVDNYGRDDALPPTTVSLLAAASNGAAARLLGDAADGEIAIGAGGVTLQVEVILAAGRDSVLSLRVAHDVLGVFDARVSISAAPGPISLDFTGDDDLDQADIIVLRTLLQDIARFNRAYDADCEVSDETARAEMLATLRARRIAMLDLALDEALDRAACAVARRLDGGGALLDMDGSGGVDLDDVNMIAVVLNYRRSLEGVYDENGMLIPQRAFILDTAVRHISATSAPPFPAGIDQVREIVRRIYLRLLHPASSYTAPATLAFNGGVDLSRTLMMAGDSAEIQLRLRYFGRDGVAAEYLSAITLAAEIVSGGEASVVLSEISLASLDAQGATITVVVTPDEDNEAVVRIRAEAPTDALTADLVITVTPEARELADIVVLAATTRTLTQTNFGDAVRASFTLRAVDNYGRDDVLPAAVSLHSTASNGVSATLLDDAADGEIVIGAGGVRVEAEVVLVGRDSTLSLRVTHDVLGAFNARVSISAAPIPFSMGFTGDADIGYEDMVVLGTLLEDIALFNRAYDADCNVADEAARAEIITALQSQRISVRNVTLGEALDRAACAAVRQLDDGSGALLDADSDGTVDIDDASMISFVLGSRRLLSYAYDENGMLIPERAFILDAMARGASRTSAQFPSDIDQVREIVQRVYLRLFHPSSPYYR